MDTQEDDEARGGRHARGRGRGAGRGLRQRDADKPDDHDERGDDADGRHDGRGLRGRAE